MKPVFVWVMGAVALAAAVGGGYWLGQGSRAQSTAVAPAVATEPAQPKPKLLYYRNPMGLPDTSPTPKKDPMGMDYIAVYEGAAAQEAAAPGQVLISPQKVQKLGVRTEAAQLRSLDRTIRASGRVEPDERRVAMISAKFEGYVERLHVNVTGQFVAKGQALFEVYSPELVSAQREYVIAVQGAAALKGADSPAQLGMGRLVESSLQRLKNWDISEAQIQALVASGETLRTLTFRSPVSGIVTEKKAVQGMRFMPGEARARPGLGEKRGQGAGQHQCLPGQNFQRQGDLCVPHPPGRDPHCASAGGAGQPRWFTQARHVCPNGTASVWQRPGGNRTDLGGD
ncbi:MAG: Cu(I)/Ag(I) efflux system membrane protein CusB [Comamonadaceae bacterium]|nr:MAG: Cu(I)/Ag(I) efflux system membrane protein CusB [Comamonadaceae bacterium]